MVTGRRFALRFSILHTRAASYRGSSIHGLGSTRQGRRVDPPARGPSSWLGSSVHVRDATKNPRRSGAKSYTCQPTKG